MISSRMVGLEVLERGTVYVELYAKEEKYWGKRLGCISLSTLLRTTIYHSNDSGLMHRGIVTRGNSIVFERRLINTTQI